MKQQICNEFQETVSQYTLRHKSILDILTKTQESCARVNRALIKSVTNCGCIKINAEKKDLPIDTSLNNFELYLDSHLSGELCPECKEIVTQELGKMMFYIAALCNTSGLDLYDVFDKELSKILTLGKFNLT